MIYHTSSFKNEIAKMGRQISTTIDFTINTNFVLETSRTTAIITEDGNKILTEQDLTPGGQAVKKVRVDEEYIYSVDIIKNGNLLQSLMKQCNIEIKPEFNIGDTFNVRLGVLVEGNYQYLNHGDYIIYSKKYNVENETWQYVAYDRMLWAMKKYTPLNVNYPITVRDYINAIANKLGVIFADANTQFVNYDKLITKDHFIGKDFTYRDILDKLAEITASNITMDGQLHVKYPTETNDVITEENLKDVNINFGEQFGPVNKIEIADKENNLYYSYQDSVSIEENGTNSLNIINNPFVFNGEEDEICKNILNKLKTQTYSINDFSTTGVCYYEFMDLFTVTINGTSYKCLLLNNEIKIQQGIEETIFTERLDNVKTEDSNFQNSYISSKNTQYKIEQLDDDKVGRKNVINAINQSKELSIIYSSKLFFTKTIQKNTDSNGFLDTELSGEFVIVGATAQFNNSNYGFIIPYYAYNNGQYRWYLKMQDKNNSAIANTNITATIYYFKINT